MHGTARPQQSYPKEQLSSELNVPQALLLMKNKRNRCVSLFLFVGAKCEPPTGERFAIVCGAATPIVPRLIEGV